MSDEFKVQITLNAPPPAQYAKGAMANFRGENVHEVGGMLAAARDIKLLELAAEVEAIWLLNSTLGAKEVSTSELPPVYGDTGPPPQWAQDPAPVATNGPPVANLRVCAHGKRTEKSGHSAKGAWTGYFCPLGKKPGSCPPEWA